MARQVAISPGGAARRKRLLDHNAAAVAALEAAGLAQRSPFERLADRIAQAVGTPLSGVLHLAWFGAWIVINAGVAPILPVFDPFPFPFLTLMVSLEAIVLSILVLGSQNVLTRQADRRAELDLQINMLAEQESTKTVALLRRVAAHLGVPGSDEPDDEDLAAPTDLGEVARTVDRIMTRIAAPGQESG